MAVGLLCFFLAVLRVILQCMIVAFPGHTNVFIPFYTVNPSCANRNKSRLLFSSAEMFK